MMAKVVEQAGGWALGSDESRNLMQAVIAIGVVVAVAEVVAVVFFFP